MDNIALLILGIFISVIGIVNMTGNISTIHSYNRRKVKEEDVPKYGRAVGTGTLIIGVSLIAAFVTTFWSEKAMSFIVIRRSSSAWALSCMHSSSTIRESSNSFLKTY